MFKLIWTLILAAFITEKLLQSFTQILRTVTLKFLTYKYQDEFIEIEFNRQ